MRKLTTEQFILKAKSVHFDKYDYSLVNYKNAKAKIKIICYNHGVFMQSPSNHIKGSGCKECANEKIKTERRLSTDQFIKKASSIHDNKYSYSKVRYVNTHSKIEIVCKIHGEFKQTPASHLLGAGCKKCANKYLSIDRSATLNIFINKANKIHGEKYKYDKSKYVRSNIKVSIECDNHGEFYQTPNHHLSGQGCPKCSSNVSNLENKYFYSLNNSNIIRNKVIYVNGRKFIPDGYDPITNTIYEFYGDYWHGNLNRFNPYKKNKKSNKLFKKLYQETIEKEAFLLKNGYKVVSIWESDFISGEYK